MAKIFVIAGTQDQAHQYIKRKLMERFRAGETSVSMSDYVSVSDANKLRGVRDPNGVLIGSWKMRADILEVLEVLSFAKSDPTAVLQIKASLIPPFITNVAINGVPQLPSDYTISNDVISFKQPPPPASQVTIMTDKNWVVHNGDGRTDKFNVQV